MTVRYSGRSRPRALGVALSLQLLPSVAQAHVKWFCGAIDPSLPPVPPDQMLSPLFLIGTMVFATLVGIGGVLDPFLSRLVPREVLNARMMALAGDILLRLAMATYALCLWQGIAVVSWGDGSSRALLTPDLLARDQWIVLLQLGIAGLVLVPRLSLFAGIGIAILFASGVTRYGAVYMMDYIFFLGIAAYLALGDPLLRRYQGVLAWRTSVLAASIGFSLMWTGIEKFLFPQWTIAVLVFHPGATFGYPFATVATIGGFVEFSLAFYILIGRAVLGRLSAFLLMGVFMIAMPEFGMLDVVGHIPVIAVLLVLVLNGETRMQHIYKLGSSTIMGCFAKTAMLYVTTLAGLTLLYYGTHILSASA